MYALSYLGGLVFFVFVFTNMRVIGKIGAAVAVSGGILNLLAIWANGGSMPVAGGSTVFDTDFHPVVDAGTRLAWLTDWIPLGSGITASIGDVLIAAGLLLALIAIWTEYDPD